MRNVFCLFVLFAGAAFPAGFKAGVGRAVITPTSPIRMSGYAARTKLSEGAVHDLWAKALALEDSRAGRLVIVSVEVQTIPFPIGNEIAARAQKQYGLARERLVLNCSHTHAGPVLPSNGYSLPEADEGEQLRTVDQYGQRFTDTVVEVIGAALRDLKPARISIAHTKATFAVNRREPTPKGYRIGVNPSGPVDQDVPVISVTTPEGKLRAVLFGYACHNTTLGGNFYQLAGDWAGFAEIELERKHPGATALFMQLCGADQNPNPRNTLELAEHHGKEMATAVDSALAGKLRTLHGPIRASYQNTELGFAPHTREMFEQRLNDRNPWRVLNARYMLRAYDAGRPIRTISYPVQAVRFGKDLTVLALGGEVVVDYALRAKREFTGEDLIVAGYSNNVMCYIPSLRVLKEGGYEPVDSLITDGMPGPFNEQVEETVFRAMRDALRGVGRKVK